MTSRRRASQALMNGLIDYAGLFPPAGLGMREAVQNFALYRGESVAQPSPPAPLPEGEGGPASTALFSPLPLGEGPGVRAEIDRPGERGGINRMGSALGRLVVPARRLGKFGAAFDELAAEKAQRGRWRLSVLLSQDGTEDDLSTALAFAANRPEIAIESFETPAAEVETIERLRALVPAEREIYFELPIGAEGDSKLPALLGAVARNGSCAKVRTGGLEAKAFPSPDALLTFLKAATEARAPWKATAGLHHAIRGAAPLTYEPASPCATMHGYLNVFLAATALWSGRSSESALSLLSQEGRGDLAFEEDAIAWRGVHLSTNEIAEARRSFCRSIGSCSFTEPVEEILALDPDLAQEEEHP